MRPARDLRLNPVLRCLFPVGVVSGRAFLFCSEQPLDFDVPSFRAIKENPNDQSSKLAF